MVVRKTGECIHYAQSLLKQYSGFFSLTKCLAPIEKMFFRCVLLKNKLFSRFSV